MLKKLLICIILMTTFTGCEKGTFLPTESNINVDVDLISSLSIKLADGKKSCEVELYYDGNGNIKLGLSDLEVVVTDNIIKKDIDELKNQYNLTEIGNGIIAVINKGHTASKEFMQLDLFVYKGNQINKIWSSKDISAKVQNIRDNQGIIDLSIPNYGVSCTINFTDEELKKWMCTEEELKRNGIKIDSNYYKDIDNNIIFSPIDYYIEKLDEDMNQELLLLLDIYSVGAKSPTIKDRAIIEFEMSSEGIEYKDIVFESDPINDKFPFAYFS